MSKYNIETIKDDLPKTANISLNHLYDHILGQKISKVHKRRRLQHIKYSFDNDIQKIVSVFQKVLNKLMIFQQWNGSMLSTLSAQDAFRKESKGQGRSDNFFT